MTCLSNAVEMFHNTEEVRLNYINLQDDVNDQAYIDDHFSIDSSDISDSDKDTNDSDIESNY